MKKLPHILLVLASIPVLTVGILFLIASGDGPVSRFLVAVVLLAAGLVMLVAGVRKLRRLADISLEALKTGAVELAKRLGGELTVSQLRAEYRISGELAEQVMAGLEADGTCVREQRAERLVYVFTGLLPSLAEKVCPYCGTELPVRSALRKCPSCGGQLQIEKS